LQEAGLRILDVTDSGAIKTLGSVKPGAFSHSGWPFEANGRWYYVHCDEGRDQGITVLDVTNLNAPAIVSSFKTRPNISVHNVEMRGTTAYVSYYLDGLRVLDLSDPQQPRQVAYYDTVPEEEERELFQGAWGVHLDGDNVYVSDMQAGVFALRVSLP
jgi:hypothetical protein